MVHPVEGDLAAHLGARARSIGNDLDLVTLIPGVECRIDHADLGKQASKVKSWMPLLPIGEKSLPVTSSMPFDFSSILD